MLKKCIRKDNRNQIGEQAEERTGFQVNSLVSMTMADKMDESETNEWRRIRV
jgi:hypothetical protein